MIREKECGILASLGLIELLIICGGIVLLIVGAVMVYVFVTQRNK